MLIWIGSIALEEHNRHPKKLGTVLRWGMGRIIEWFNRTTQKLLGPTWNHLTDKIRIHWCCNLGERWHHNSQFWGSREELVTQEFRMPGTPPGGGTPPLYILVPGYGRQWPWTVQFSGGKENDFFRARSSLTLQTVEQIKFTFSFLNVERKGYFPL